MLRSKTKDCIQVPTVKYFISIIKKKIRIVSVAAMSKNGLNSKDI